MARIEIDIPFLRTRRGAGGKLMFYWIPSATLQRAGWKAQPLGADQALAMRQAEAINAKVADWRLGKVKPAGIRKAVAPQSFGDAIRKYRASNRFRELKPQTQRVYADALSKLEAWAGGYRIDQITTKAVQSLYDALRRPSAEEPVDRWKARTIITDWNAALGGAFAENRTGEIVHTFTEAVKAATPAAPGEAQKIFIKDIARITNGRATKAEVKQLFDWLFAAGERLHTAGRVMRVLSALWKFMAADDIVPRESKSPASLVLKATPLIRRVRFSANALDVAVAATANYVDGNGDPRPRRSLGTALLLAHELGQREADILALQWRQWDGTHIMLTQEKTGEILRVKATQRLREHLEALKAETEAARFALTHIVMNEETNRRYRAGNFQHKLRQTLDWAIEKGADVLGGLEYRDLRRTAVVNMGEIGMPLNLIASVSGHRIETTQKILNIYLPRSDTQADKAIDTIDAHRAAKEQEA